MKKTAKLILALLMVVAILSGCSKAQPQELVLSTTTSTENSGLLAYLLPDFESKFNATVKVVAVGTGAAIEQARNGEADVLIVHSLKDELKFVEEGYAPERIPLMYNDFIIVGPKEDPAGIKDKPLDEALNLIASSGAQFASRGDDSGTHKKETSLVGELGIVFKKESYVSLGQGMGETLTYADEKGAYTLTDRGTYLSMSDKLNLEILVEGDDRLFNPYGVMLVNSTQKKELAQNFVDWISSKETKGKIAEFGKNKYGQSLFFPY